MGLARAVGVSNFNTTHLKDISDAGLELPSVNQCSFAPVVHGLGTKVKQTRSYFFTSMYPSSCVY